MQGLAISKLIPWKALALLVAGLIVLGLLIQQQGVALIGTQLGQVGPVFLAILGLTFFFLFLQTFAWQVILKDNKGSFWSLFKIKAGGDALNALLPFSLIGGTAVQDHLLRERHQVQAGADSIVIDRNVQNLAVMIFVWVGLIVGFLNALQLPATVRIGVPFLLLLVGIFFVVAIRTGGPGFFAPVMRRLGDLGLPFGKSASCRGHVQETDRLLLQFYQQRSGAFYQALFLQLLCQGLMVAEVYLIGRAIFAEFSPALALLLAAATPLITGLFTIIPGAFGILELIYAGILMLAFGGIGAAAGITIVLVRRARALVWIIVGMILTGNPFRMFLKP